MPSNPRTGTSLAVDFGAERPMVSTKGFAVVAEHSPIRIQLDGIEYRPASGPGRGPLL